MVSVSISVSTVVLSPVTVTVSISVSTVVSPPVTVSHDVVTVTISKPLCSISTPVAINKSLVRLLVLITPKLEEVLIPLGHKGGFLLPIVASGCGIENTTLVAASNTVDVKTGALSIAIARSPASSGELNEERSLNLKFSLQ